MKSHYLTILKDQMLEYLKDCGYCESTVMQYDYSVKSIIVTIVNDYEITASGFDDELAKLYLERLELRFQSGDISRNTFIRQKRVCRFFNEFCKTKSVQFSVPKDTDLTPYYAEIIRLIYSNSNWSHSHQDSCRSYSRAFFKWLILHGNNDLSSVNEAVIQAYFLDCTGRMNNNSLSSTRYYLRSLFAFLYDKDVIASDYSEIFLFEIPVERKVHKPISQADLAIVLNSIDRTTSSGKRNYAMIMTALKTGLRQCDIINLKLTDIDWKNGVLNVSQSKTGKAVALPLTRDYGEAITDYLLNGRLLCDSEYVFISERPPFTKLGRRTIYCCFNSYRNMCGLPPCSFHGVRRMLGSSMIAGGVSVDMVPSILGQSDIDASRPYIYVDSEKLQDCSLSLSNLPEVKGVKR